MKRIKDLTEQEREQIIDALKEDGFTDVVDHVYMISYKDAEFRDYELFSTNLNGEYNDDDFLNIFFREKEFFSEMQGAKTSIKIGENQVEGFLKTRHTVSIENKILNEDIDSVVSEMDGWKLKNTWSVQDTRQFFTIPESLEYSHIVIKGKNHLSISEGVNGRFECYELNPEAVISHLTKNPKDFALKDHFVDTLNKINSKRADL